MGPLSQPAPFPSALFEVGLRRRRRPRRGAARAMRAFPWMMAAAMVAFYAQPCAGAAEQVAKPAVAEALAKGSGAAGEAAAAEATPQPVPLSALERRCMDSGMGRVYLLVHWFVQALISAFAPQARILLSRISEGAAGDGDAEDLDDGIDRESGVRMENLKAPSSAREKKNMVAWIRRLREEGYDKYGRTSASFRRRHGLGAGAADDADDADEDE